MGEDQFGDTKPAFLCISESGEVLWEKVFHLPFNRPLAAFKDRSDNIVVYGNDVSNNICKRSFFVLDSEGDSIYCKDYIWDYRRYELIIYSGCQSSDTTYIFTGSLYEDGIDKIITYSCDLELDSMNFKIFDSNVGKDGRQIKSYSEGKLLISGLIDQARRSSDVNLTMIDEDMEIIWENSHGLENEPESF